MIRLRRMEIPADRRQYSAAWLWRQARPDLYRENLGFADFGDFCKPELIDAIDLLIESASPDTPEQWSPLAMCSLVYRGSRTCQFSLILPPKLPNIPAILAILPELERLYFEDLGFTTVYVSWPAEPQFLTPRRLAGKFGWRQVGDWRYEFTIIEYLERRNLVTEKPTGQSS